MQNQFNSRIKIFLVSPSLHKGGAEKVMSILANHLNKSIFDVTLVLLQRRGSYLTTLDPDIKVLNLNISNVRKSFLPLLKLIRNKKPDIVFSVLSHLNIILSIVKFFSPIHTTFIARETNIPSIINKTEKFPIIFNLLYKLLFSNFDKIVCQSHDMANDLMINYNIKKEKIEIINNPVDFESIKTMLGRREKKLLPINKLNVIAIGSLEYRKGFDLLIKSWDLIKNKENLHLTIIGIGSLEENLKKMIYNLRLADSVNLLGFKENPYLYMEEANIAVLPSRFEGFPNVMLETMACGTPVVAFNCPGGINEIIINDTNGWIVAADNIQQLAQMIEKKVENNLSENIIIDSVKKRYKLSKILKKYEFLFQNYTKRNVYNEA